MIGLVGGGRATVSATEVSATAISLDQSQVRVHGQTQDYRPSALDLQRWEEAAGPDENMAACCGSDVLDYLVLSGVTFD